MTWLFISILSVVLILITWLFILHKKVDQKDQEIINKYLEARRRSRRLVSVKQNAQ